MIAPQVAMAADTPQIDTALDSITPISSSTFILRASQKVKYHTLNTTTMPCRIPKNPASKISPNSTDVPSSTSPILM